MVANPAPRKISAHVLTSLAILKANWDLSGTDYIENFVPFVAECLVNATDDEITASEVQKAVQDTFGLRLPQGALKTILQRCTRHGYLTRRSGKFIRNKGKLHGIDLSRSRSEALRKHENLIEKLVAFCRDRHSVNWSNDKAEAALQSYVEQGCFDILAAAVEGCPIPPSSAEVNDSGYLVNAFAQHLFVRDQQGFEFLETVVKGTMLANVLIFPELGKVDRKFDGVEVYFDTGFLLGALGLEGPLRQQPCVELLELLYEQNANLCVFEHTFDEISGVLDAAAKNARNGGAKKPTLEFFEFLGSRDFKASDIELVIARLRHSVERLRIRIKKKPEHSSSLGLNEKLLDEIITGDIKYTNQRAKEHDIDSLTSIHRLRKGETFSELEHCRAIFVTTNTSLVKSATRFFKAEYEHTTVPLCLQDYLLSTVVWLKNPLKAPDLPRKRIVADCYAALNPPDRLWRSYLIEIEQLKQRKDITQDDYNLLRYSTEARYTLMDLTLGNNERVDQAAIAKILTLTRDAITADARAALASSHSETAAAIASNNETKAALEQERAKRIEADMKAQAAILRLAEKQKRELDKFSRYGNAGGVFLRRAFVWGTAPIFLLLTFFALPSPLGFTPTGHLWRYIVPALFLGGAVWSLVSSIWGTSVISLGRTVELRTVSFVEEKLKDWFGDDSYSDCISDTGKPGE